MRKRILSILLTLCMLLCLVPTSVFAEGEAATGTAAIQFGTDAISVLSKNANSANAPTVYFGQDHENNPGAWRVIDYDGNSAAGTAGNMTLLAANNMGLSKFGASNAYADSALKEAIDALADKLTAKETDAVEKRTLASGNYDGENTDGVAGPAVSNAVFWPLSSKEANAVNNDLRVVDPEHPGWASSYWWLRSPDEDYSAAFVAGRGEVRYYGGYSTSKEFGVRPAFNLNSDSVLFASAAVGGKPDGGLQPVSPNYTGNEWKLTLYDSKRNNFSRTTWEVSASTKGGTVEISYTDAKTGANEYISALIFDDVGNVIYYGRSNASLTEKDGTAQLTIPAGFAEGTYTLEVFNEQYNGDRKTDLASGFADVTLTVEKRVDEQFTLTPGGRYYFDLSAVEMPGTTLETLPDSTLHYVPFTYVGTVDAYSMENETDTAKQPYEHSLFIADYNVKCSLQRETLAEMNLIYGQTYTASNVNYTLRAPSVGDHHRNEGEGSGLAPIDNEWDTIYQKSADYIKNWYKMRSFGQDIGTGNVEGMYLSRGGHFAAQATFWARPTLPERDIGFRPLLELPTDLAADSLKIVELRTGEFMPGEQQNWINIIVKKGESFTAPSAEGLPRPDAASENALLWWTDGNGAFYRPGDTVPADVSELLLVCDYDVTYLPGAYGAGEPMTESKRHNVALTLRGALFTRTGHTQVGWATVDGGEKVYGLDAVYTQNEALALYPVWNTNQYTITFDTNGGSEIAPITQDYGTNITAPADPTREGYTFIGWDREIPTTMPAENITLTARWKDSEKPTGEIKISNNSWKAFLNNITFGLFFKDTQTVTITAADNSGETVTVEYLLSDKELTKAELDGMTFTAYTAPFGIDPDNEYIIYVRLTDNAGNTDYICSDGIVLDGTSPVITGIEDGKTYCEAQMVTITEKYVDTVTVNGTAVTLDENNSFTLAPADGEQKIVVTDKAGNTAEMTVTVNDGHTFGEWTSNGDGTHTRQCTADGCTEGIETGNCVDEDKNHICDICGNIISNHEDANQDHVCDLCGKVISNHEDANKDHICDYCGKVFSNHEDADKDHICDLCGKTISNHEDADKDHICDHCGKVISNHEDASKDHVCELCGKTISNHEDADNDHVCDYCGKVITNHIGGKATCKDKAVCEVCGKSYGKLDPNNHTDLKHFPAKAATEDADGNIEYWYCSGCNKYYSDKDGTKEIKKADTVTAKLKDDSKSPQTGDTSNLMLWIALLFVSGGVLTGVTVFDKRKRHSVK